jgi:guanosine-3',5'-bis(diphosphate) 3'-pyrophosphohydrolase
MPIREQQDKAYVRNRLMQRIGELTHWDKASTERALEVAENAHDGHYRMSSKYDMSSPAPFIVHSMRVALILIEELHVFHPEPICAALLHDVVEDTGGQVTTFHLEKQFGRNVALMVSCVTRPVPDVNISSEQQMQIYQERIARSAKYTRVIKLAERLDNLRDLVDSPDEDFQKQYLQETVDVYLPIATKTDPTLHAELASLCEQLQQIRSVSATTSE